MKAFRKLDKSGDGVVTIEDLRGYSNSLMWSNTICIVFIIIVFTMRRSIPSSEMVFGLRNKFLRASLKHLIAPMTPMERLV